MTIIKKLFPLLLLLLPSPAFSASGPTGTIRLSAAASMTDAVRELAAAYAGENPGVSVLPNFGASGLLAKQIAQGAPADIFISANAQWMEHLVKEKKIDQRTVRVFASNSLVFLGKKTTGISSLDALPLLARIAIGSPKSTPAGQYARQAMRAAGVYEALLTENKLALAKDVRQALLYADQGEVDGAFVYKTDARLARNATILFTVPAKLHDRIDYQAGLTVDGEANEAAKAFIAYLSGPQGLAVLEKFGFLAPNSSSAGTN